MATAMISSINGYLFNLRTRYLNNVIFQIIQILIPLILSFILDSKYVQRRRTRGIMGVAFIGTITLCSCAGLAAFIEENDINQRLYKARGHDWTDSAFAKCFVIYLFFGMLYSGLQIFIEWILAALTNDPAVLARYAGLFKGTGSLGICVSFLLDSRKVPYIWQLTVQFVRKLEGLATEEQINHEFEKERRAEELAVGAGGNTPEITAV
ncbi:putative membrane protein [Lachnellula subtilissima]|uniref:Putative membrane protein n=1 Tax=Lachnellula subtilissima TaxID=602034 RepID=A0A8H8UH93_9HELO|nr:putative membrane protein [Lachnellula subtilissima]